MGVLLQSTNKAMADLLILKEQNEQKIDLSGCLHIKVSPQEIEGWESLWLSGVGAGQSLLPCKAAFSVLGRARGMNFLFYHSFYLDAFPPHFLPFSPLLFALSTCFVTPHVRQPARRC